VQEKFKDSSFFNGQLLKVISFVENKVVLELIGSNKIDTVSLAHLRTDFCLGLYRTMYSIQGRLLKKGCKSSMKQKVCPETKSIQR